MVCIRTAIFVFSQKRWDGWIENADMALEIDISLSLAVSWPFIV